jgi:Flp pilus assembly protein TadD
MTQWMLGLMLAACLVLVGGTPISAAPAPDKVKEATERAAKDYLQHGLLLSGEGRDEQAVKSYRQAISLKPDWAEAHSLLGSCLSRVGQYREAEAELRKAVALKPDYAEGWYFLGLFLKDRGKDREAQEAFQKAKQFAR